MSEEKYSNIGLLKLVDLFHFMGFPHAIYKFEEDDELYLQSKGLVDQVSLDWKSQRLKLLDGDNRILFGVKNFISIPDSDGVNPVKNDVLPPSRGRQRLKNKPKASFLMPKEGVYQRLNRVQLWIARLSTSQMRALGNSKAADEIFELQDEWGDALHSYETHGLAIKDSKAQAMSRDMRLFTDLLKNKSKVQTPAELAIYETGMNHLTKSLDAEVHGDLLGKRISQ